MVTARQILAVTGGIARRFKPERIIVFGSYVYGTPNDDSDVDLLLVTNHDLHPFEMAGEIRASITGIRRADVLVWRPRQCANAWTGLTDSLAKSRFRERSSMTDAIAE